MNDYPLFDVDENGNIFSYYPDEQETTENSSEIFSEVFETVSQGDFENSSPIYDLDGNIIGTVSVISQDGPADFSSDSLAVLESINEGIQTLALNPSNTSYLSDAAVSIFDRVVDSQRGIYYMAYRTGSDNYDAVLYYSHHADIIEGSFTTLQDDVKEVRLYRQYVGNQWQYHYTVRDVPDQYFYNDEYDGTLIYTNTQSGYPTLGDTSHTTIEKLPFLITAGIIILYLGVKKIVRRNHQSDNR